MESLNSAFDIMPCPLDFPGISSKLHHVLTSLAVLEPKDATVFFDIHHAGTGFNFIARE